MTLAGCTSNRSSYNSSTETASTPEAGAKWKVIAKLNAALMPEEAKNAFDQCNLATAEVLKGTNYSVLCYLHDDYA